MEYRHVWAEIAVGATDDRARDGAVRITAGGEDNADGRLIVPFRHRHRLEAALCRRQQVRNDIAFEAQHQNLAFGIAEAGIVFDEARTAVFDHQPGIEHARIGHPLGLHARHGRVENVILGNRQQMRRNDRRR